MTIEDMHYDFKKKLNKVDSQQYKNLLIPEIDWVLNEAQSLFIDMIAQPRLHQHLGFERTQKNIDDIRTVVVENHSLTLSSADLDSSLYSLPGDYRYYIKGFVLMSKGPCGEIKGRLHIQRQGDEFEEQSFYESSYKWRHANGEFVQGGLRVYHKGDFIINDVIINYIENPEYMHNAANFRAGSYNLPSGTVLTGTQDSVLPDHVHREIVDLAVLITTGEIQAPDFQLKFTKLQLNNLK